MTVYLGSVFRAVLTVTLSGLIWALDIALYYSPLGHGVYGEPLDPQVRVRLRCPAAFAPVKLHQPNELAILMCLEHSAELCTGSILWL